jgi:hypothetical protein
MVNHDIMSQYRVWCQYLQYRSRNISSVLVVSFLIPNPQHFVSCILSIVSCDVIFSLCPWMRPTDFHNNLKIHETRMCLQKHRRCDTTHDGGFALQSTFFGTLQRRATPGNLLCSKNVYQLTPLLGTSVHGPTFFAERVHTLTFLS